MDKKLVEWYSRWSAYMPAILAIWFFIGMPLSILLSGLYMIFGVPLPSLLYFLPSLTYLSGGILGGTWSGDSLRRNHQLNSHFLGSLFLFAASIGFLGLGIIFAVIGFRRL